MPTSSRAARAFGVMSSPSSAATPALAARQARPFSSARALKIASAIGLRQTFAVQMKRILCARFILALASVNYLLPLYLLVAFLRACPTFFPLWARVCSRRPRHSSLSGLQRSTPLSGCQLLGLLFRSLHQLRLPPDRSLKTRNPCWVAGQTGLQSF